jgi:Skp family chaperone for outer membrane proteins
MKLFKNFFLITFIILFSLNNLKADEKISYLDIEFILANTLAGKSLLENLKKVEDTKINEFKANDLKFQNNEKKILAKKNIISNEEIKKEINALQIEFQKYKKDKTKEIKILEKKTNENIINFLNLINPIIEKYMTDNSIYILIDKKNVFIANKDYDITKKLIELIDNQIKTVVIK